MNDQTNVTDVDTTFDSSVVSVCKCQIHQLYCDCLMSDSQKYVDSTFADDVDSIFN